MSLNIVSFETKYASYFRDLNLAWIKHYFEVEIEDSRLLENCEQSIIASGGYIYFAKYNDAIVGCFALIKKDEKTFELGKMAVDPSFHGLKIGQKLLSFAIDFARKKSWETLVLYSSTKLDTALHIYRKYGFKVVALEEKLTYLRSDIKMELLLNEEIALSS